jgi:histidinol-phosphate aminotransferase
MNKVRDSYNIDFITQAVAKAALDDVAYMRENAARICATRDWLADELRKMGCKVLPSQANFIFVKPRRPAPELFAELRKDGFIVRYFNLPRISEFLRITIGTREDMESFLDEMRQLDK